MSANDPAFPNFPADQARWYPPGLTKREHAAIALCVPDSGDPELDAMIHKARHAKIAAQAMQGLLANPTHSFAPSVYADESCICADALIAELEKAK